MSAYVVNREVVTYLIESARTAADMEAYNDQFHWYHDGQLECLSDDNADHVGQMLWDENVRSVTWRYPDWDGPHLPGCVGEGHPVYRHPVPAPMFHWDPVQVLSAIDHYDYQSCESEDWRTTQAFAFANTLKNKIVRLLPGYGQAVWGAPAPAGGDDIPPSLRPASAAMEPHHIMDRLVEILEAGGIPSLNFLDVMARRHVDLAACLVYWRDLAQFARAGANVIDARRIAAAIEEARADGLLPRELTDYDRYRVAVKVGEMMRGSDLHEVIEGVVRKAVINIAEH